MSQTMLMCYCKRPCFVYTNVSQNTAVYKCAVCRFDVTIIKDRQKTVRLRINRQKKCRRCRFKRVISFSKLLSVKGTEHLM